VRLWGNPRIAKRGREVLVYEPCGERPHLFGMPVHYDLHAWILKHNPAEVFAHYNPRVSCP
jgi:hypothetical protein